MATFLLKSAKTQAHMHFYSGQSRCSPRYWQAHERLHQILPGKQ